MGVAHLYLHKGFSKIAAGEQAENLGTKKKWEKKRNSPKPFGTKDLDGT